LLYLAAAVTYSIEAWIYRGPLHVLIGLALGVLLVIYVEWRAHVRRRSSGGER